MDSYDLKGGDGNEIKTGTLYRDSVREGEGLNGGSNKNNFF